MSVFVCVGVFLLGGPRLLHPYVTSVVLCTAVFQKKKERSYVYGALSFR